MYIPPQPDDDSPDSTAQDGNRDPSTQENQAAVKDALHRDANQGDVDSQRKARDRMRGDPSTDNRATDTKASPTTLPDESKYSFEQIIEKIKKVGGDPAKISPSVREAYEAHLRQINEIAAGITARLIEDGLEIPPGCPVKIEKDQSGHLEGNGAFQSRVRNADLTGRRNAGDNNRPVNEHLNPDEAVSKLAWIKAAQDKLRVSDLDTQVNIISTKLSTMGEGVKGWIPAPNMTPAEKESWLQKVGPWLEIALRAESYYKACEDINQASQAGFSDRWSFSRLHSKDFKAVVDYNTDFPGRAYQDASGERRVKLELPTTLARTEANRQMMERLEKWIAKVEDPLSQAVTEFANSTSVRNLARACLWGDMPLRRNESGITPGGQHYNRTECRFVAETVKVPVKDKNGEHLEDRIKVTTSRQKQWLSSASYDGIGLYENTGEPETSGVAKVKVAGRSDEYELEPGKTISIGSRADIKMSGENISAQHASLRLTDDGRIQVRSNGTGSGVNIIKANDATQATPTSTLQAKAGEWVDLDPGDKLQIGQEVTAFENDTRLYKPTDWVAIQGVTGHQVMQAKDLNAWATDATLWDVTGKATSLAMDVGFLLTGTIEAGVVFKAGLKEAGWSMARNAAWHLALGGSGIGGQFIKNNVASGNEIMTARSAAMILDVAASSGFWGTNTFGKAWGTIFGKANEPVIAKILAGEYGLRASRPFLSRVGTNATTGEALYDTWYNEAGEMVRVAGDYQTLTIGERIKDLNDGMLQLAGSVMIPSLVKDFVLGTGDDVSMKRGKGDANAGMAEASERLADSSRLPPVRALVDNLIGISDEKAQKVIKDLQTKADASRKVADVLTLHELQARSTPLGAVLAEMQSFKTIAQDEADAAKLVIDKEVQELAQKFAYSDNQTEKVASALALMRLRQKMDGSLPDVLATYKTKDQAQKSITLIDAEKIVYDYRPVHLIKSKPGDPDTFETKALQVRFDDAMKDLTCSPERSSVLIDQTRAALALPLVERQTQIEELSSIFLSTSNAQDKAAAAMGLLLLNADNSGAIPQLLCPKDSWHISVSDHFSKEKRGDTSVLLENDPRRAEQKAKQNFRENNVEAMLAKDTLQAQIAYYDYEADRRIQVTSSSVVECLKAQLADSTKSASARLGLADTLQNMGQLSPTALGGLCQEIINDKNIPTKEKALALVDGKHARLLQLLPNQRYVVESIIQDKTAPIAERGGLLGESLGRNALNLQESLLELARNKSEDPNLRTLALSVLQISNITDAKAMSEAITALEKRWGDFAKAKDAPANSFANNFVVECRKVLEARDQASDSFVARQKAFQVVLSIRELGDSDLIGVDQDLRQKALTGLLKCLRVDKETETTIAGSDLLPSTKASKGRINSAIARATDQTHSLALQIVPMLAKDFNQLSVDQKAEFRQKSLAILDWTYSNDLTTPQAKSAVLEHIGLFRNSLNATEKQHLDKNLRDLVLATTPIQDGVGWIGFTSGLRQANTKLGVSALRALSNLSEGEKRKHTSAFLEQVFKDEQIAKELRASALELLSKVNPENLDNCLALLSSENDPAIRAQLETLFSQQQRQDPLSPEFRQQHERTKASIKPKREDADTAAVRDYINSHCWNLTANDFSNARTRTRLPDSVTENEITSALSRLETTARQSNNEESKIAQDALEYIVLSSGRPFHERHRDLAVKSAATSLYNLCKESSPAVQAQLAPMVLGCLGSQTLIPREARETLANGLTWLDPGKPGSPISAREAAQSLSLALQFEHKIMPNNLSDPDIKLSQDSQLHLLNLLSRYAGPEEIPQLAALVEDNQPPQVEFDKDGRAVRVPYPDGSSREVSRRGDEITSYLLKDAKGNVIELWARDKGAYYSENDKKHEHPWFCDMRLEKDGRFVITDKANPDLKVPFKGYETNNKQLFAQAKALSPGGTVMNTYGTETTFLPSGGKIERSELGPHGLAALWISITYPDGSQRSRVIDQQGKGSSPVVYRANQRETIGGYSEHKDPMLMRPNWLPDPLSRKVEGVGDYDHIDYKTGDIVRYDQDTLNDRHVIHLTTLHASGLVDCERYETTTKVPFRGHFDPNQGATTSVFAARPMGDKFGHPLPLVQETARELLTRLTQSEKRERTDFSADRVHARYEAAKIQLQDNSLRPLIALGEDWFRRNGQYQLLDAEIFGQHEQNEAQSQLWAWQRPFIDPYFEAADTKLHKKLDEQMDNLLFAAQGKESSGKETAQALNSSAQARAALAYIILTDGRPFRSEADRTQAVERAAQGVLDICRNKSLGAGEMASVVAGSLLSQPTLNTRTRSTLFLALKEMEGYNRGGKGGALAYPDIAPAIVTALEAESKSMPPEFLHNRVERWKNPVFKDSEALQVAMLDYLKGYKGNIGQLEAILEKSPSIPVQFKAKELLRSIDRISDIDFVAHAEIKPTEKAATIAKALKDTKANEDRVCQTIISNCDIPFSEKSNRIDDPRADILLEAMKSTNERIRVAAARGYTRCMSRSYIDIPEEVLLTVYELSQNGKRTVCREEAASTLASLTWRYKFDPNGDLWTSKIKPRLDELSKTKKAQQVAQKDK